MLKLTEKEREILQERISKVRWLNGEDTGLEPEELAIKRNMLICIDYLRMHNDLSIDFEDEFDQMLANDHDFI